MIFQPSGISLGLTQFVEAGIYDCGEKEMKGEEFHICHFDVFLEAMDFDTGFVVDVNILLLSHGK